MQRYQTGLSKLGPSNRENAFRRIYVSDSEVERLTQSQARDRQQPKQAVVGPGAQRVDGRPSFSGLQQFVDFVIGIEVWSSARRSVGQQTEWRNFCRGIRRTPVPSEAAHDAEPRRPLIGFVIRILCGPLQCQLDGDVGAASSRQKGHKLMQTGFMPNQLKP